jgi:GWxTD domain-containing protein
MKMRSLLVSLASFVLLWATPAKAQRGAPYVEGMILAETDDWIAALDLWSNGMEEMGTEGRYDPRIGVAYVKLVTERRATGYYEAASQVFLDGFSTNDFIPYRDVILEEAGRIQPLFDEEDREWHRWDRMIREQDPRLSWEIKRFWLEKDPTPGTPYNERLIEHWERIAYARKNFGNESYGPYETDDRGTLYVRFGPPDKKQGGVMGADDFELRIRIPPDTPGATEVRNRLSMYDYHPNYEIWAYDELNPQDVTFYLFGNYQATGRFQLVETPRDLIHPSAWSANSRRGTPGAVRAGYYMELFYYGELARMGGPFGRRHSELESFWDRMAGVSNRPAPNEETLEAFSIRYETEDAFGPEFPALVPVLSDYEGSNREMELVATATRLLSRDGEPQLVMTALSSPRTFVEGVRALRRFILDEEMVEEGMVQHTLIVRDEALMEVGRLTERSSSHVGDISIFTLRHLPRQLHYTVLGEVVCCGNQSQAERRFFPGQAHLFPAEPLSSDPEYLEVSDIVTGLPIPDEFDPADLYFPLVPSRTIWRRDPLRVYLEAYHLREDTDGLYRYRADFRMVQIEGDTEVVDEKNPPVTLSVELESADPRNQRFFDINVRDLSLGNYRLEVTVTDLSSGESKSRVVQLKLLQ